MQDNVDGLIVISLHFKIRNSAVALGCCNTAVAQQILNGGKIGIGIQQLSGHRVSQMVTEYVYLGLP